MNDNGAIQDYIFTEKEQVPFQYLVNDIIPRSPKLAYQYGIIQYYGALDAQIDEYLIINLESQNVPIAQATSEMLSHVYEGSGIFGDTQELSALAAIDTMPPPFKGNPDMIISTIDSLVGSTMMGYYSEWAGYGSTRLAQPNQRELEYEPVSWSQIGYPGPSLGYRVLRQYEF